MVSLYDVLGYLGTAIDLLLALVLVVVGAVVLRPVSPTAGYAVVAAGTVRLLLTCCTEALFEAASMDIATGTREVIGWSSMIVNAIRPALVWALIGFAAYTVAQAKRAGQGS